jgi:putative membrane protein
MATVAAILVAVVAAIHVYIVILEMLLWRTPRGLRAFGTTQAFADESVTLAANQGLYNGFLVAGLVWGLLASDPIGFEVKLFFLGCVIVAGVFGAAHGEPPDPVRAGRTCGARLRRGPRRGLERLTTDRLLLRRGGRFERLVLRRPGEGCLRC